MRHLIGIGLAVVLSAAIFFGGGWGYNRLFTRNAGAQWSLPAGGGNFVSNTVVTTGLAAMAGVALLVGLALLIRWVSPLATGLPGLALLAWTALYVVSPGRTVHYIPLKAHNVGLGFAGLGSTGLLGAAGIVLVLPLFFPSRWRRQPASVDAVDEDEPIEATMVTSPSSTGLIAGMGSSTWQSLTAENPRLGDSDR
ncbi:MAG TPA: hypothetical protein VMU95_34475 [Trebonia sp.]|nr:hypothetical protein [Trebonia sp.]